MPTVNLNTVQAAEQITRDERFWHDDFFSTMGGARNVSYAFRSFVPADYENSSHNEKNSFSQMSATQIAMVEQALALWADVANITFTRDNTGGYSNNATMLFGNYQSGQDSNNKPLDNAGAFAHPPGDEWNPGRDWDETNGDVWLNLDGGSTLTPTLDSYTFETIIHEIGHALGLQHPGNYNAEPGVTITYEGNAEYIQDTTQYSIMSYFDGGTGGNADSPLLHDIAALQRLYGINWGTRNTNTTYGFNSTAGRDVFDFSKNVIPHIAIWDGGGIDTIDLSGYHVAQRLDLRQEAFSDISSNTSGQLINNFAIARLVDIENAIGGSAGDTITGNALSNDIRGGGGSDLVMGLEGNDWLFGGTGQDELRGGDGDDTLFGEDQNDDLYGEGGDDDLRGGSGNDYLDGGTGNDIFTASDGNDIVWGDVGNDSMAGNDGNDQLLGGWGNDLLDGGAGNDTLIGHEDTNTIFGRSGDDRFESYAGGINTVNGNDGNDWYVLGDGADTITDDSGYDTIQFTNAALADWAAGSWSNDLANDFWDPNLFEQYIGTGAADRIVMLNSFTVNFTLRGGAGADVLTAGGGQRDVLQGGIGNDSLVGGTGTADSIDVSDHFGSFSGGWTIDLVNGTAVTRANGTGQIVFTTETDSFSGIEGAIGSSGNDTVFGQQGYIERNIFALDVQRVPLINGGNGVDTLNLASTIAAAFSATGITADDHVTFTASGAGSVSTDTTVLVGSGPLQFADAAAGHITFSNIEHLNTGDGNDTMTGATGKIVLATQSPVSVPSVNGGAGTDTLALADTISNALVVGGTSVADDIVIFTGENAGTVTTATFASSGPLGLSQAANGHLDFSGIETLLTGAGADTVTGSAFAEIIDLGTGDDNADGNNGRDNIKGDRGNDTIAGGGNSDWLYGGTDNDTLQGEAGNDRLFGNAGNDILSGGRGADSLNGSLGADAFLYGDTDEGGDTIVNFEEEDTFQFDGNAFGNLTAGTLAQANFWSNTTGLAHDQTDRFIYNTADDSLWYDSNGSLAGGTIVKIAVLTNDFTTFGVDDILIV